MMSSTKEETKQQASEEKPGDEEGNERSIEILDEEEPGALNEVKKRLNLDSIATEFVNDTIIFGQNESYKIVEQISNESQNVYKAQGQKSKEIVVVKQFAGGHEQKYLREKEIYEKLSKTQSPHFLCLIDHGESGKEKFLVLPLMDSDLIHRFEQVKGILIRRTNGTKVILCKQMLKCLQDLHSVGLTHGDLKWNNFGVIDCTVILFDFERSQKVDENKEIKIAPKDTEMNAYAPYASLAYHDCEKLHFKDDLESLCYMFCEFFTALPWLDFSMENNENNGSFHERKLMALQPNSEFLNELPDQLRTILSHVRNLKYNDIPDYLHYQKLLNDLFEPQSILPVLDWNREKVYHGSCMPPHKFVPYYIVSRQNTNMILIYNCERWLKYNFLKLTKTTTFYYTNMSKRCCKITVNGFIKKETIQPFTIADIKEKKICEQHLSQFGNEEHICTAQFQQEHKYFFNSDKIVKENEEGKKGKEKMKTVCSANESNNENVDGVGMEKTEENIKEQENTSKLEEKASKEEESGIKIG